MTKKNNGFQIHFYKQNRKGDVLKNYQPDKKRD